MRDLGVLVDVDVTLEVQLAEERREAAEGCRLRATVPVHDDQRPAVAPATDSADEVGAGGERGAVVRPTWAEYQLDRELVVIVQGDQVEVLRLVPSHLALLQEFHPDVVKVNVSLVPRPEDAKLWLLEGGQDYNGPGIVIPQHLPKVRYGLVGWVLRYDVLLELVESRQPRCIDVV